MKKMLRDVVIGSLLFVMVISFVSIKAQSDRLLKIDETSPLVEEIELENGELVLN